MCCNKLVKLALSYSTHPVFIDSPYFLYEIDENRDDE